MAEKHQTGSGEKRLIDDTKHFPAAKRLQKNDELKQFYAISKIKKQRVSKFRTTSMSYKVTFKDNEVTNDVMSAIQRLFETINVDLIHVSKSDDRVRMTV